MVFLVQQLHRAATIAAATAAGLVLPAHPALAALDGIETPVLSLLVLLATVLIAALAYLWMLRKITIFRDAMASVPRPRQIVDPDGLTFYATPAFRDLFGDDSRPTPEYLADQAYDREAQDRIDLLARNAVKGIADYAEIRVRVPGTGRQGSTVPPTGDAFAWRYVAAYPLEKRPGYVYWLVDDVKPLGQIEQLLLGEQKRFVDLLRDAPIGFYSVDGEGRFLFVNETLAEWLGQARSHLESGKVRLHEVIARALPRSAQPSDPFGDEAARGEVALKAATGGSFEAFIGQEVERDAGGAILRAQAVVRHLGLEQASGDALARAEERFGRFFEEAPLGVALIDKEGRITEFNSTMADLVSDADGIATEMPLLDLLHEESRPAVEELLNKAGRNEALSDEENPLEVRLAGAGEGEGETVCALFLSRLERDAGDLIAYFIDTSEQKSLERRVVQSQKMQAVGQLAGGIAHDFNNLLTAMIGFSDLLLLRHRPGDQSFADIMQVKQNANRAANLVRQLLAFSRQQTLQSKVIDITDILAELSHLLRRLIGENIELKMVHGRDLGTIKADQGQLEQVIINLAVNARDAMPDGGTLTIRTENLQLERTTKRKGESLPAGDYTRIEVTDTGSGMTRDTLDRIFDPFFTTKEVGAGTGLGLSTVYGIVKQTGGFVFVDSKLGTGTTFTILLPHNAETEEAAAQQEPVAEASRDLTGIGTLLLVEDEDAVRAFSARALRNKGYNVLEARSGEAALELLAEQKSPIDLLITDVVMPKIDGPSLVKKVRGERPDLKVIFISGYAEDAFRKRLDQDAGIHFLPKPFSLKQLAGKVKEVIGEKAA